LARQRAGCVTPGFSGQIHIAYDFLRISSKDASSAEADNIAKVIELGISHCQIMPGIGLLLSRTWRAPVMLSLFYIRFGFPGYQRLP